MKVIRKYFDKTGSQCAPDKADHVHEIQLDDEGIPIGESIYQSKKPIVAANEAAQDSIRAALSEDLQPLGEALFSALQADDQAAMNAALNKISARMPEFMDSPALESLLAAQFAAALTDDTP